MDDHPETFSTWQFKILLVMRLMCLMKRWLRRCLSNTSSGAIVEHPSFPTTRRMAQEKSQPCSGQSIRSNLVASLRGKTLRVPIRYRYIPPYWPIKVHPAIDTLREDVDEWLDRYALSARRSPRPPAVDSPGLYLTKRWNACQLLVRSSRLAGAKSIRLWPVRRYLVAVCRVRSAQDCDVPCYLGVSRPLACFCATFDPDDHSFSPGTMVRAASTAVVLPFTQHETKMLEQKLIRPLAPCGGISNLLSSSEATRLIM